MRMPWLSSLCIVWPQVDLLLLYDFSKYRSCPISTRGLYILNPLFGSQKHFFFIQPSSSTSPYFTLNVPKLIF